MTRPRFDAFFDSTVERGASVTPICLKPSTDRTANRRRRNHGRVIVPLAGPFSSPSRINDLANDPGGSRARDPRIKRANAHWSSSIIEYR